jgi:hypothetical protein
VLLMGVPTPPPPAHEICWVMAMSASDRAIERILERGNRLRTSGEESRIAGARAEVERAGIGS